MEFEFNFVDARFVAVYCFILLVVREVICTLCVDTRVIIIVLRLSNAVRFFV